MPTMTIPHTTVLGLWIALLVLVNPDYVVAPLGAVGAPATLLGVGLLLLWVVGRSLPSAVPLPSGRLRLSLSLYLAWVALSFVIALRNPTDSFAWAEVTRAAILLSAAIGPCLLVAEFTARRSAVEGLIRLLVVTGATAAVVGIVQFYTAFDPANFLIPPGLELNPVRDPALEDRSLFVRPRGTARHPIEFGVVMATLVPFALWWARRSRAWSWAALTAYVCLGLVAFGALTSISRSAVLVLVVSSAVMFSTDTPRQRLNDVMAAVAVVALTRLVADGLIGTLLAFFQAGAADPSIEGRTRDFDPVLAIVLDNPVTGIGWAQFNPTDYFILDNQILDTLLESGIPGAAFLILLPSLALVTLARERRGVDEVTGGLGSATLAALAGSTVTFLTFDAFSFPIFTGIWLFVIGLCHCLVALEPDTDDARTGLSRASSAHHS